MFKRIAASVAAAAVGGVTLMAASSPAMAHPSPSPSASPSASALPVHHPVRIVSVDVTPDPVVVKGHGSVPVTATVKTVNAKDVSIRFEPTGRHGGGGWHGPAGHGGGYKKSHPGGHEWGKWDKWDTWHKTVSLSRKHPDGTWAVIVTAQGRDGKQVEKRAFFNVKHVKWNKPKGPRATRIAGFDVAPEPVRKYRKLALSGKLEVARCYNGWYLSGEAQVLSGDRCDYDNRWHNWHWLGEKDITVLFQEKWSGKWKYVDTLRTNPDGSFFTKVRALKSGTWKVVFKGSYGLTGAEAADYVKVVR